MAKPVLFQTDSMELLVKEVDAVGPIQMISMAYNSDRGCMEYLALLKPEGKAPKLQKDAKPEAAQSKKKETK